MEPTRETLGDDDAFATLILAAREDAEFGEQLVSVLSLEAFHRKSLLNTLINEMRLKGAPESLTRSMTCLLDDSVAERALAEIERELE